MRALLRNADRSAATRHEHAEPAFLTDQGSDDAGPRRRRRSASFAVMPVCARGSGAMGDPPAPAPGREVCRFTWAGVSSTRVGERSGASSWPATARWSRRSAEATSVRWTAIVSRGAAGGAAGPIRSERLRATWMCRRASRQHLRRAGCGRIPPRPSNVMEIPGNVKAGPVTFAGLLCPETESVGFSWRPVDCSSPEPTDAVNRFQASFHPIGSRPHALRPQGNRSSETSPPPADGRRSATLFSTWG